MVPSLTKLTLDDCRNCVFLGKYTAMIYLRLQLLHTHGISKKTYTVQRFTKLVMGLMTCGNQEKVLGEVL